MSIAIGVGLGIGLAVLGAGIGQGLAANGALQGVARQPEAGGRLLTFMILGCALIESLVIIAFIVVNGMAGKIPAPAAAGGRTGALVQPLQRSASTLAQNGGIVVPSR